MIPQNVIEYNNNSSKIKLSTNLNIKGLYMDDLKAFYGPNAGYVLELYDRYRQNPASVDSATRAIFDTWSPGSLATTIQGKEAVTETAPYAVSKVVAASSLAHAIRSRGHLGAHLDPLGREHLGDAALLTETHGITDHDL